MSKLLQILLPTDKPLSDIYPSEWKSFVDDNTTFLEFRNLQHFKSTISLLSQRNDDQCGITFAEYIDELRQCKSTISSGDYEIIKNRVKQNLLKRGLISENIYEAYEYAVEGEIIDIAKYAEGNSECMLKPVRTYTQFFYELYISVSYPYHVSDSTIVDNMAKLLATIELLEREHYYCKLTLVFPDRGCNREKGKPNLMVAIPLFSHKDPKTIETMSSILNEKLLRKGMFSFVETLYGNNLDDGYGTVVDLPKCIVPVDLDEVAIAEGIVNSIIEPCKPR